MTESNLTLAQRVGLLSIPIILSAGTYASLAQSRGDFTNSVVSDQWEDGRTASTGSLASASYNHVELDTLLATATRLISGSEDIESAIVRAVDEEFWDLLA